MKTQLALFVLAGGLAACANFFSRIVFSQWLPYTTAIVIAYIIGMMTAFVLNRLLVFKQANNSLHHQIFWFTLINLVAVLQTLAVSLLLARIIFPKIGFSWHTETIAHAFGVTVPVLTSFFGHKNLSFRTH